MSKTIWIFLIAAVVVIAGTGFLAIGLHATASESTPGTVSDSLSNGYLTETAAKQIALSHAGVSEAEVTHLRVSFDRDDGRAEYEIDFRTASAIYEYELDASSGDILKHERETIYPADTELSGDVAPDGTVSGAETPALLTEEEATRIVLEDAGVTETEISGFVLEKERDDGRYKYDIEFRTASAKYEYTLDAETGDILKAKCKETTGIDTSNYIGEADAKAIVLAHAGVSEAEISRYKTELDRDDGRIEYDVEFYVGNTKYEYTLDASSGDILSYKHKGATDTGTDSYLTEADAKAIAFAHAGVSEAQVSQCKIELDRDDGRLEYEIEFRVGNAKYEYTLDASSGDILGFKNEEPTGVSSGEKISETEAKAIALAHAGVSEAEISRYKIELDRDDGRLEYEIEFRVGNAEYEYTLDAATGKILEFEIDW